METDRGNRFFKCYSGTPVFQRQLTALLTYSWFIAALLLSAATVKAANDPQQDYTQFSLEQLISVDVYGASKFMQKASDAPSAVTVITADDIKVHGYRKLIDILRSVRGVYSRYDRNYDFLGFRGFSRPGDYNSRYLLLVDGYRINDAVYDTATVGTEFLLDVDLIDRVEFIPGPGSSIYGSNAFFGVINVITRQSKDINGFEGSISTASYDTDNVRLSYGKKFSNGLDVVLSGSFYDRKGQDLYFSEFDSPANHNGIATHLDYDRYSSLFAKIKYDAFTVTSAYSIRKKGIPTGAFGTTFNDPDSYSLDTQAFINVAYDKTFNKYWNVMAQTYYGYYPYDGNYPYISTGTGLTVVNKDGSRPRWWGGELKVVNTSFDKHKLVFGTEYRNNIHQDQFNYDENPRVDYADSRYRSTNYGIYVQDEYSLNENWIFNLGVRNDHYGQANSISNPRLGIIYKPSNVSSIKFLYGTAFRAPNAYELYHQQIGSAKANPTLKPEKIKTYETIFEKYFNNQWRFLAGAFYYKTRDLINLIIDPADGLGMFQNLSAVSAKGVEFEAERKWNNHAALKVSLTYQKVKDTDTGDSLSNSPKMLSKVTAKSPLFWQGIQAGFDLQYTAQRKTVVGEVGGYPIANLTFLNQQLLKNLEISASIYNLFDKDYADPTPDDLATIGVDSLRQDGRNYRVKLTYRF